RRRSPRHGEEQQSDYQTVHELPMRRGRVHDRCPPQLEWSKSRTESTWLVCLHCPLSFLGEFLSGGGSCALRRNVCQHLGCVVEPRVHEADVEDPQAFLVPGWACVHRPDHVKCSADIGLVQEVVNSTAKLLLGQEAVVSRVRSTETPGASVASVRQAFMRQR